MAGEYEYVLGDTPRPPAVGGALCTPALRMAGEYEYVLGDTPRPPAVGLCPSALPVWELRFRGSADQPLGPLPEGRGEKIENSKETPWLNHSKSCSKRPS